MLLPRRLNRHRKRDFKVSPLSYARQVKAQYLGCSEGSRGLFVVWRVGGIFTAVSISPSTSWRQWPSDYAIHPRRNLPDKELRYLRQFDSSFRRIRSPHTTAVTHVAVGIGLALESVLTLDRTTDQIADLTQL